MAIQYKAQTGSFYASASAANTVVPILSNVPAGDYLIATFRTGSGIVPSGVTDTKGNTWIYAVSSTSGTVTNSWVYSCFVTSALTTADTVTFAHTAVANRMGLILQFSGLQSLYTDQTNSNNTSTATSTFGTNATPALSNSSELAIISLATNVAVTAIAATGFTVFSQSVGAIGYKILSNDNTAQSGTWTWTTNSANTGATISTYKPDQRGMALLGVG